MSSVLGVSVGAGAIRLARPPAGADPCAEPDSYDMRTFVVPPETPSAERAALSVAAALNSNPAITATVLACRDEQQARALHTAMSEHGLTAYDIVPDIEAVLEFAVASGALKDVSTLAVFDLGSSGLSVTVVDVPTRQVRHTERTGDISGEYFDSLIREQQINSGRIAHPPDPAGLAELDALCRSAKERLAAGNAVALPSSYGPVLLTQENFTALIGRSVETSARATREVIARSGRPVQALLAVGGGMRIPLVSQALREAVDMPILVPPEPETAAARGAALLAGKARTRAAEAGANDSTAAAEPRDRSAENDSRPDTAPAQPGGSYPAPGHSGANNPLPGVTAPIPNAASPKSSGTLPNYSGISPDHSGTFAIQNGAATYPSAAAPGDLDSDGSLPWAGAATAQLGRNTGRPAATTTAADSVSAHAGTAPAPPSTIADAAAAYSAAGAGSGATSPFGDSTEHLGPPASFPGTTSAFSATPTAPFGTTSAFPGATAAYPGPAGPPSATTPGTTVTAHSGSHAFPVFPAPATPGAEQSRPDLPIPQHGIFGPPTGAPSPPPHSPPGTPPQPSPPIAPPQTNPPGTPPQSPPIAPPQSGPAGAPAPSNPPGAPATGSPSASPSTGLPSAPPPSGTASGAAPSPVTPSPAPGQSSAASPSAPALPRPISTPVPRLTPDEDPPTVALRLPAKLLPRRSFGEPPQRRNREISAPMVAVSALVVLASIGIGLGYGQHMFSKDSATVQSPSQPDTTSAPAPSATSGPPAPTATTTSEHASLAEPPPVYQPEPETTPPVTPGPNTWEVLPGLPPIVVPTIPPEALPFPGPRR
ncbi:Hsp70 family protein [Nocardia sp. CA-290969]|uniref:Hsp70 family protein n=1 Tax=Nocardia sp. CA-290969 TaxID=3239986 RepID=UPI003D8D654E